MTTDQTYDPADDEDDDAPVGLGDRLRAALASSDSGSPLYPRLLRLRNVHPNGWQRAALVEGMAILGGLAALADRATAWAPLILPVAAAAVVKFHDVLAGVLPARRSRAVAADPDQ
jgi:hypothetical protein